MYEPNLKKLQKTFEYVHDKMHHFSTVSNYNTMWDKTIDHERDGIHGFSILYLPNADDIKITLTDVDIEGKESQISFTSDNLQIWEDAWNAGEYLSLDEYKKYLSEEQYFQTSTLHELPSIEFLKSVIEVHNKVLELLEMKGT